LTAFAGKPLFGYGLGASVPTGYYRAADRPYLFELQYHQLLFTSGLAGLLLVAAAGVAAWVGIRRAARACTEHVPVLVASATGAAALLIVNASNPYLQAVGHGWGLALVVGVANALLDPDQRTAPDSAASANAWRQKYYETFGRNVKASHTGRTGAIGGN
jgi:O-antigen ligase